MGTPGGRGRRAGVGRAATGEHARRPRPAPAEGRWLANRGDRDRPPSELGERMAGPWRRGQGRPTARSGQTPTGTARGPLAPATGAAWRADQAGSPLGGRTGGRAGAVAPRLAQPGALTESRPLPHTKRPVQRRGRRARSDRGARAAALAGSSAGPGRSPTAPAGHGHQASPASDWTGHDGADQASGRARSGHVPAHHEHPQPLQSPRLAQPGAPTAPLGARSARTASA